MTNNPKQDTLLTDGEQIFIPTHPQRICEMALTIDQIHTLINQIVTREDRDNALFELEQAVKELRWEGQDDIADELDMHLDSM